MDYLVLMLEQVYGAITYCMAHGPTVEAYLKRWERDGERLRRETPPLPAPLAEKLRAARAALRRGRQE